MMTAAPYRTKMRAAMIEIATRIVDAEGLPAVQARRVSQEAGCAVGTLYNVFGGLDYLIIDANALTLAKLGELLTSADDASLALADRLVALAKAYLDFATTHSNTWRAVFEHHMSPGSTVPDWYRERQDALFGLVETILEGVVADKARRRSAARALFSAVHGIVVIALDQKLGAFETSEAQWQVEFVVRSVAGGLTHQLGN